MRIEELSDAALAVRPHRIRGAVADALLGQGAITAARAVAYAPEDPAVQRALAGLVATQVVRMTADRRCWFDLRTHYAIQGRRERMRAMIAVPLAIVAAGVVMLFYSG